MNILRVFLRYINDISYLENLLGNFIPYYSKEAY